MAWKVSLLFLSLLSTFVLSSPDHEVRREHDNDDSEVNAALPGYVPSVFTVPSGRLSIEPCTSKGVSAICWVSNGVTLNSPFGSEVTSGVPPAVTDPAVTNISTASNTTAVWDKTILVNNNSSTTIGQATSTIGNNLTTTILVEGTSSTTLFPNSTQAGPINTAPASGTAIASQDTGTGTGFVPPSGGWNTSSCSGYLCPGGPQPSWTGWPGRPRPTGGFPPPFNNATGTGGVSINATVTGGISTSYRVTSTITSSIWVSGTGCCNASSATTDDSSVIGPINTALSPPFSNATVSQPTASPSPAGTIISSNGTAIQPTMTAFPSGTVSFNVTSFAPTASGSRCWALTNSMWTRLSTCTDGPAVSSPWLDWNNTAPFPTGTGAGNATRPALTGTGGPGTNTTNSAETGTEGGAGRRPPRPTDAGTESNSTVSSTSSVSNATTTFPSGGTGLSTTINLNDTTSPGTGVSSTTPRPSTGDGTGFPSAASNATSPVPPSTNSSTSVVGPGTGIGSGTGTISYSANGCAIRTATASASVSNTLNVNATAPFPSPPVDTTCTTSTSIASSNFTIPPGPGVSRPPPSGSSASASTTTVSSSTTSSSSSSSGTLGVSATFISLSSSSSSSSYTLSTTGTAVSPSSSLTTSISGSPDPGSDNATRPAPSTPPSFSITTTVDRGVLQCFQSIGPQGETLGSSCLTTLETSVLASSRTDDGATGPGETGGDWRDWGDQQRGIVEREFEEAAVVEMEEHGDMVNAQEAAAKGQGASVRDVVRRGMRIPEGTLGYGGSGSVYGREAVGAQSRQRVESEADLDHGAAAAMDTETGPSHERGWLQRMVGL